METERVPGMNRARYREIDSRMRKIVGRRRVPCASCVSDGDHLLDRVSRGGDDGIDKYVGVTAAVGVAISIPELAKIKKGAELPAVIRRSSVLAALYARAILASCRTPEERREKLREVTSFHTADNVEKLASRMKGGELERFEMALMLALFQGALGEKLGIDHASVKGYQNALRTFDEAILNLQKQAAGVPVPEQKSKLNALAGLGAPVGLGALGGPLDSALDWVVGKLSEMGKQASELLCRAMNAIFTGSLQPVGGVICAIIRFTLGGFFDTLASGAAIVKVLFTGLADFFSKLFAGQFTDAALALATAINQVIIIVLGGGFSQFIGIPIVDAQLTEQQKRDGVRSLEAIGKALPPTFTISLVASVIGMIVSPTPGAVSALIVTFTPAVVEILGPALKNSPIEKFRTMTLDKIKLGIAVVIKIGSMVVAGVMSLSDVIRKFGIAVREFAKRMVLSQEARERFVREFMQKFPDAWNNFMNKLKAVQLMNAVEAGKALFGFLPDLLGALAASDPGLADAIDAGREIVETAKSITQQAKDVWKQAFDESPRPDKIKLAWEQATDAQKKLALLCSQDPQNPYCQDYNKALKPCPTDQKKTGSKGGNTKPPPKNAPKKKGISGVAIAAITGVSGLAAFAIAKMSRS